MKRLASKISILMAAVVIVKLCAGLASGAISATIPEHVLTHLVELELGSSLTLEGSEPPIAPPAASTTPEPLSLQLNPGVYALPEPSGGVALLNSDREPPSASPGIAAEPTPGSASTSPTKLPESYMPQIVNQTSIEPDIAALLRSAPVIAPVPDQPQILIVHTHGSEAFAGVEGFRTLDKSLNIVRVGDALTTELQNRGFNVLHDRNIYDYPSYSGSYERSARAVAQWLEDYPTIQVVFDIHRDAVELPDGSQYRTAWQSGDSRSISQVMTIVTNGEKGLSHPRWTENLSFALALQREADSSSPGLMRPLCISGQRFNEQLSPGYLLLEVGSCGDTIEEAVAAARQFAIAIEAVLTQ
ncbi:MAG: stage II sporulation protein P [Oscillospiraceae bacterium]|jgi:stage II sporulation protein P|nr:stage II sporulation protein P [Oscillospiraceae bacterium]